jgi:hypothetical protein
VFLDILDSEFLDLLCFRHFDALKGRKCSVFLSSGESSNNARQDDANSAFPKRYSNQYKCSVHLVLFLARNADVSADVRACVLA